MTISFRCPHCGNFCAIDDQHSGKRATCQKCWQIFIIPAENHGEAEKIITKEDNSFDGPISGFYRAALVENFKEFIKPAIIGQLLFIATAITLKFFLADKNYVLRMYFGIIDDWKEIPIVFGHIMALVAWGCLFWLYIQVIYTSAFGTSFNSDIGVEGVGDFLTNAFKSLYTFGVILIILFFPAGIAILITKKTALNLSILTGLFSLAAVFLFPMALLTVSVGRDIFMAVRLDYFVKAVIKGIKPYLVVFALVLPIFLVQWITKTHGPLRNEPFFVVTLHLLGNIFAGFLMLFAARGMGLFYRHYSCYMP